MPDDISDVAAQLTAAMSSDTEATAAFAVRVYDELRERARALMSRERRGHTLEPTALVNEAYARLLGNSDIDWQGRTHFFAVAARQMRRILIDIGRRPGRRKLTLQVDALEGKSTTIDLLALEEAMIELETLDERAARVVELKFFAGLSEAEIARLLEVSERTVRYDWNHARAWLADRMSDDG